MDEIHLNLSAAASNGRDAVQMYRQRYPHKRVPCKSLFTTLHRQLCKAGSLSMHSSDAAHRRTTRAISIKESVRQEVESNPFTRRDANPCSVDAMRAQGVRLKL